MFSKLAIISSLAIFAVASPAPAPNPTEIQCNTGTILCCESFQNANNYAVTTLLGLLGIPVQSVTGPVGVTCSPASGTGANCVNQPVCCENNNFSGLIAIGCSPINIVQS